MPETTNPRQELLPVVTRAEEAKTPTSPETQQLNRPPSLGEPQSDDSGQSSGISGDLAASR